MLKKENNFEKFLLVLSLGLTEAIKSKAMTINDAEQLLFSPRVMKLLKNREIGQDVIDLIHLGTELEDIDSLLPKRLSSNLNQMSELALDALKKMPKVDSAQSAWYDQLL